MVEQVDLFYQTGLRNDPNAMNVFQRTFRALFSGGGGGGGEKGEEEREGVPASAGSGLDDQHQHVAEAVSREMAAMAYDFWNGDVHAALAMASAKRTGVAHAAQEGPRELAIAMLAHMMSIGQQGLRVLTGHSDMIRRSLVALERVGTLESDRSMARDLAAMLHHRSVEYSALLGGGVEGAPSRWREEQAMLSALASRAVAEHQYVNAISDVLPQLVHTEERAADDVKQHARASELLRLAGTLRLTGASGRKVRDTFDRRSATALTQAIIAVFVRQMALTRHFLARHDVPPPPPVEQPTTQAGVKAYGKEMLKQLHNLLTNNYEEARKKMTSVTRKMSQLTSLSGRMLFLSTQLELRQQEPSWSERMLQAFDVLRQGQENVEYRLLPDSEELSEDVSARAIAVLIDLLNSLQQGINREAQARYANVQDSDDLVHRQQYANFDEMVSKGLVAPLTRADQRLSELLVRVEERYAWLIDYYNNNIVGGGINSSQQEQGDGDDELKEVFVQYAQRIAVQRSPAVIIESLADDDNNNESGGGGGRLFVELFSPAMTRPYTFSMGTADDERRNSDALAWQLLRRVILDKYYKPWWLQRGIPLDNDDYRFRSAFYELFYNTRQILDVDLQHMIGFTNYDDMGVGQTWDQFFDATFRRELTARGGNDDVHQIARKAAAMSIAMMSTRVAAVQQRGAHAAAGGLATMERLAHSLLARHAFVNAMLTRKAEDEPEEMMTGGRRSGMLLRILFSMVAVSTMVFAVKRHYVGDKLKPVVIGEKGAVEGHFSLINSNVNNGVFQWGTLGGAFYKHADVLLSGIMNSGLGVLRMGRSRSVYASLASYARAMLPVVNAFLNADVLGTVIGSRAFGTTENVFHFAFLFTMSSARLMAGVGVVAFDAYMIYVILKHSEQESQQQQSREEVTLVNELTRRRNFAIVAGEVDIAGMLQMSPPSFWKHGGGAVDDDDDKSMFVRAWTKAKRISNKAIDLTLYAVPIVSTWTNISNVYTWGSQTVRLVGPIVYGGSTMNLVQANFLPVGDHTSPGEQPVYAYDDKDVGRLSPEQKERLKTILFGGVSSGNDDDGGKYLIDTTKDILRLHNVTEDAINSLMTSDRLRVEFPGSGGGGGNMMEWLRQLGMMWRIVPALQETINAQNEDLSAGTRELTEFDDAFFYAFMRVIGHVAQELIRSQKGTDLTNRLENELRKLASAASFLLVAANDRGGPATRRIQSVQLGQHLVAEPMMMMMMMSKEEESVTNAAAGYELIAEHASPGAFVSDLMEGAMRSLTKGMEMVKMRELQGRLSRCVQTEVDRAFRETSMTRMNVQSATLAGNVTTDMSQRENLRIIGYHLYALARAEAGVNCTITTIVEEKGKDSTHMSDLKNALKSINALKTALNDAQYDKVQYSLLGLVAYMMNTASETVQSVLYEAPMAVFRRLLVAFRLREQQPDKIDPVTNDLLQKLLTEAPTARNWNEFSSLYLADANMTTINAINKDPAAYFGANNSSLGTFAAETSSTSMFKLPFSIGESHAAYMRALLLSSGSVGARAAGAYLTANVQGLSSEEREQLALAYVGELFGMGVDVYLRERGTGRVTPAVNLPGVGASFDDVQRLIHSQFPDSGLFTEASLNRALTELWLGIGQNNKRYYPGAALTLAPERMISTINLVSHLVRTSAPGGVALLDVIGHLLRTVGDRTEEGQPLPSWDPEGVVRGAVNERVGLIGNESVKARVGREVVANSHPVSTADLLSEGDRPSRVGESQWGGDQRMVQFDLTEEDVEALDAASPGVNNERASLRVVVRSTAIFFTFRTVSRQFSDYTWKGYLLAHAVSQVLVIKATTAVLGTIDDIAQGVYDRYPFLRNYFTYQELKNGSKRAVQIPIGGGGEQPLLLQSERRLGDALVIDPKENKEAWSDVYKEEKRRRQENEKGNVSTTREEEPIVIDEYRHQLQSACERTVDPFSAGSRRRRMRISTEMPRPKRPLEALVRPAIAEEWLRRDEEAKIMMAADRFEQEDVEQDSLAFEQLLQEEEEKKKKSPPPPSLSKETRRALIQLIGRMQHLRDLRHMHAYARDVLWDDSEDAMRTYLSTLEHGSELRTLPFRNVGGEYREFLSLRMIDDFQRPAGGGDDDDDDESAALDVLRRMLTDTQTDAERRRSTMFYLEMMEGPLELWWGKRVLGSRVFGGLETMPVPLQVLQEAAATTEQLEVAIEFDQLRALDLSGATPARALLARCWATTRRKKYAVRADLQLAVIWATLRRRLQLVLPEAVLFRPGDGDDDDDDDEILIPETDADESTLVTAHKWRYAFADSQCARALDDPAHAFQVSLREALARARNQQHFRTTAEDATYEAAKQDEREPLRSVYDRWRVRGIIGDGARYCLVRIPVLAVCGGGRETVAEAFLSGVLMNRADARMRAECNTVRQSDAASATRHRSWASVLVHSEDPVLHETDYMRDYMEAFRKSEFSK